MSTFGEESMRDAGPKAAGFGSVPGAAGRRAFGRSDTRPRSTAPDFGALA